MFLLFICFCIYYLISTQAPYESLSMCKLLGCVALFLFASYASFSILHWAYRDKTKIFPVIFSALKIFCNKSARILFFAFIMLLAAKVFFALSRLLFYPWFPEEVGYSNLFCSTIIIPLFLFVSIFPATKLYFLITENNNI